MPLQGDGSRPGVGSAHGDPERQKGQVRRPLGPLTRPFCSVGPPRGRLRRRPWPGFPLGYSEFTAMLSGPSRTFFEVVDRQWPGRRLPGPWRHAAG